MIAINLRSSFSNKIDINVECPRFKKYIESTILARAACLPRGLYVLLALIFYF